jgi:hypothetical protein
VTPTSRQVRVLPAADDAHEQIAKMRNKTPRWKRDTMKFQGRSAGPYISAFVRAGVVSIFRSLPFPRAQVQPGIFILDSGSYSLYTHTPFLL